MGVATTPVPTEGVAKEEHAARNTAKRITQAISFFMETLLFPNDLSRKYFVPTINSIAQAY
jgi:hypothetical protein